MEDTWTIGNYEFFCTLEWFEGSSDKTNEYWTSKGRMRRGQAPAGYYITIRISPPNEHLSHQIYGLIRLARSFKGPSAPWSVNRKIESFWETGTLGQEDKIFEDVRKVLERELPDAQKNANKEKMLDEAEKRIGGGYGWQKSYKDKYFSKYDVSRTTDDEDDTPDQEDPDIILRTGGHAKSRRLAPKIAIVFVAVIIAAVFVLGNGEISLPDISFPDITGSCETIQALRITSEATQGKISLQLCKEMGKDVLTVSGELHKSAQVNLTLFNPDLKKIEPDYTFVSKKFSRVIEQDVYENDYGKWRIKITINGEYRGDVLYFDIVKP